jgi:TonB-dependent receptor
LPNPIQTWDISEEVSAAYLMANFETSNGFFGNLGVRYVETEIDANGTSGYTFRTARPTYMDLQDSDCTSVASGVCFVEVPVAETKSYEEFLPSFNLNYLLNDEMMLRFAVSKTMARATFNDVRPNGNVNIPSSGGGAQTTFSGGNPQLEPLVSNNIDVSWEWYFGDSNLFAVALFYKDMEDFVFSASTLRRFINPVEPKPGEDRSLCPGIYLCDETLGIDPVTGEFPIAEVITTLPVNGAGAEIFGVEVSYQQTFDNLPGFWGGLGFLFNYTFADSEADYTEASGPDDPYEGFPFINTSEHSINSTLFWENDRASARLAYNWRDEYLVSPTQLQMSTWSEGGGSLDASFTIDITDRIALTGNGVNLLDFSSREYQTIAFVNDNQPGVAAEGNALDGAAYDSRTKTINYFGRTYRLGIRVTF